MNKLPIEDRAQIIAALVEGNSIRSVCRMTGFAKRTVSYGEIVALADVKPMKAAA